MALGLKKETADCYLVVEKDEVTVVTKPYYEIIEDLNGLPFDAEIIPAWCLHRLIEMMPRRIECDVENGLSIDLFNTDYDAVTYYEVIGYYTDKNLYNAIISCIEDLIKEGYFNKEYLE